MTALKVHARAGTQAVEARLLCLHGWGFDHRCWQPLADELLSRTRLQLDLVDLPGFGDSPPVEDWVSDTRAQLRALIEASELPVYLLGWSLGGQVALDLAQHCAKPQAVFTVAANLQFCAADHWPAAMNSDHYNDFLTQFTGAPAATVKRFSQLVAAGGAPSMRKLLRNFLASCEPAQHANWLQALRALQQLDASGARPSMPVHMLFAEADQLVPLAAAEAVVARTPFDVFRLGNEGHGAPVCAPAAVADWLIARLPESRLV